MVHILLAEYVWEVRGSLLTAAAAADIVLVGHACGSTDNYFIFVSK